MNGYEGIAIQIKEFCKNTEEYSCIINRSKIFFLHFHCVEFPYV